MSKPKITRSNSSSSIEQKPADEPTQKTTEKEKGGTPPTLTNHPPAQTPFDRVFNPRPDSKQQFDDESSQEEQQPQGNLYKDAKEQAKDKQGDTAKSKKIFQSKPKVLVPALKLPGISTTATLKTRAPVSPDSTGGLGSHRVASPRTGVVPQAASSSSVSTTAGTKQGLAPSSTPPAKPLPPLPQTPNSKKQPVSTSNVQASARSDKAESNSASGVPAHKLSQRSQQALDSALVNGKIDPFELGYLLVEVQTAGYTLPTSIFTQGKPFLRGGLQVLNFTSSDGQIHDSVNLIEKFLQPLAEKVFNTPECNGLRRTLLKNYLPVASSVDGAARGMRPKEMQQSEKIKNLMDPVIKPFTTWVCGENENMTSSQLPEAWKSLLLGIDNAVVFWVKNKDCINMKEIKSLRSEAMIAFISTRGYMMAWGTSIQKYSNEHNIGSEKFSSFLNSYFAHRANKFIIDIMLSRKDLVGDSFESKMRGYLKVLGGHKEFVSNAPKENASGRRQLMKSKTMQSTKAPPANSSNTVNDESATLSPRMREKVEVEKTREIKQKQSVFQRQKFVSEFSRLVNLAKISPEFFKAFQTHVVEQMSDRAYQKFEKDPVQLCTRYLGKFYVGVLNKERQTAEKSIRAALATIRHQDIAKIVLTVEKVKSYVKPESELLSLDKQISQERKIKFLGEFTFYTNTNAISKDFLISFKKYILELNAAEYVKFEATPIASGLAFVEKWYSSLVTTSPSADRNRLAAEKNQLVDSLKNTPNASIKGLKDSMAASSTPASDPVAVAASPRANLDLPGNPTVEDEKQAIAAPLSTASEQSLQDSRTPSSSTAAVKLVQENEISTQRRNDFLVEFYKLANINDISNDFDASFKKHILELSASDYVKFLRNPIANCRDYVNYFYNLPVHQETKQSRGTANEDKPAFLHFLSWNEKNNLVAITKLAAANLASTLSAGISTSTASSQLPQDSRALPTASVKANPVAKDAEPEKTEPSSEPEVVTESDSDADNASSEKTEES